MRVLLVLILLGTLLAQAVIIIATTTATVLTSGLAVHLLSFMQIGGAGAVLTLGGTIIAGAAFTMLMIVMKGLLRSATTLENELAEVV